MNLPAHGCVGRFGEALSTVGASVGRVVHRLLVAAQGSPVGKAFFTLIALVGLAPHVDLLVLIHQLVVVAAFVTDPAPKPWRTM